MADYLAPGIFVEEIPGGPRPIEGVATGTAAFLGETERGPTKPQLVTSHKEYERHFGTAFGDGKYLPYAISGFFENGGRRAFICRVVGAGATSSTLEIGGLRIDAVGAGTWGNRIHVRLDESSAGKGPAGFRLRVAYWQAESPSGAYPDPFEPAEDSPLPKPALVEDFDGLVWDDPASPDFYQKRLQDGSAVVGVTAQAPLTARPQGAFTALGGGGEAAAAPGAREFAGDNSDPALRTGLAALDLDAYREVALIAAPAASDAVVSEVQSHCERNRFRFAVVDSPAGMGDPASLDPRSAWDTSYAAFYYPWIAVTDLQGGDLRLVPPSGHVLGLYARTDIERGVWKAPTGDILRGAADLEHHIDSRTQDMLNPRGVNAIRSFPGRGVLVWGARTLSSNPLWKYVSVRRLFLFLERSIQEGTQWVVFEPNDERLWAKVRDTIRLFLRTQWRNGALMGQSEEQAFVIACDRSTMTQDDILNGRLICEIGIAPVRPAEFVIFRIFQTTAEARS